jgi:hypothetical protein
VKTYWKLGLGLAVALLVSGCDRTGERNRSSVEFVSVAENGIFLAGMIDAGADRDPCVTDDNTVPAGHVPITLHNRPYNEFNTANEQSPFGLFHVTEITVEWVTAFGASPADAQAAYNELIAFNFTSPYDVAVPIGETVTFNALVVPLHMKSTAFFQDLLPACVGGTNAPPFSATALITLAGHDSGSEEIVYVQGAVIVEFIGAIID